jgi:hypothetical protein
MNSAPEGLIEPQLVIAFPVIYDSRKSITYTYKSATGPYPEPDECNPSNPAVFI